MGGSYSIVIDGENFEVEVRDFGSSEGRKQYQVRIGGKEHVVLVDDNTARQVSAKQDLSPVTRPVFKEMEQPKAAKPKEGGPAIAKETKAQGTKVPAPMTGKIVSIKVKKGQEVKEGDLLLLLEAMKMENSILAPADGVVNGISVNVGDSVRKGDELCILS